jgi:hypothetical protein
MNDASHNTAHPLISGKAIAALVFGVLSFFTLVTGIPGLVLGFLSLRDIKRNPECLTGRGFAIAGLVLSAVGMFFLATFLGVNHYVAMRMTEQLQEARIRNEITQLHMAVSNFEGEYGYLPSRITLNDPSDTASTRLLARMFPRYDRTRTYKWNGQNSDRATLEGHQCLVFFLGGIPTDTDPPVCQGFSTNPADPTEFSSPRDRKAPLFAFDSSRLKRGPNGFLYYLDPSHQAPYAYFRSGATNNSFNPDDCRSIGSLGLDCGVVKPYFLEHPLVWQIISAGADGKFGPGGIPWSPACPVKAHTPGADDLANFADGPLGRAPS